MNASILSWEIKNWRKRQQYEGLRQSLRKQKHVNEKPTNSDFVWIGELIKGNFNSCRTKNGIDHLCVAFLKNRHVRLFKWVNMLKIGQILCCRTKLT